MQDENTGSYAKKQTSTLILNIKLLQQASFFLYYTPMSEFSILVQEYYKNPVNNYQMKDCDFFWHEGNSVCDDDINVYIQYEKPSDINTEEKNDPKNFVVTKRSYDGNVSMITQAASSFFSELVVWQSFSQILMRDEKIMIENGFEVTPRRRRARVIALLATRNAIHQFLKDGKIDTFEDVLQ